MFFDDKKSTISLNGAMKQERLEKILKAIQVEMIEAHRKAVLEVNAEYMPKIKAEGASHFPNAKKNFKNTFTSKLYDKNKSDFVHLTQYSRLRYYDIFALGGIVNAKAGSKLLIPYNAKQGVRDGKKERNALKQKIDELRKQKALVMKTYPQVTVLYARVTSGTTKMLNREKRRFKEDRGIKSVSSRKNILVPIAFLYDAVKIPQKYNFKKKYMAEEAKKILKLQGQKYNYEKIQKMNK